MLNILEPDTEDLTTLNHSGNKPFIGRVVSDLHLAYTF